MVAVIFYFQLRVSLVAGPAVLPGELAYSVIEIPVQFVFGDSANRRIYGLHGYVEDVVQTAEHAELAEFSDTGEQHEPQLRILGFHHAVEIVKQCLVVVKELLIVHAAYDGDVVFVDEHDDASPRSLIGMVNQALEAVWHRLVMLVMSVYGLVCPEILVEMVVQGLERGVCLRTHVEVQHGVLLPRLGDERVDGETLEKFAVAAEEFLERGHKQTLSEPSRTAQEVVLGTRNKIVDVCGLVNVDAAESPEFLETLYSQRVNRTFHNQFSY